MWPDELSLSEDDKLVSVCHFYKDVLRTHGVPFKFVVKKGERFAATRARLQQRLNVPEKDFAKYRFALIQLSQYKQPLYLEDDDVLFEHRFAPDDVLGIDHIDLSGSANRYHAPAVQDRGIRIRS